MIQALSMVNQILSAANLPTVTTIEGTRELTTEKAVQALNHVGIPLGRFIFWRFLHARAEILTVAEHTTGTVGVTNGSANVTGTGTGWIPDMVGRAFKITSYDEVYRIKTVRSATSIELETPYNGTTIASLGSYTIAEDRYLLNEDYDSEIGVFRFLRPSTIELIPPEQFDEMRFGSAGSGFGEASFFETGDPRWATIETDPRGRQILVLDPFPRDRLRLPITYYRILQKLARDEDIWPFPSYIETVLRDGALHYIKRDSKNDPQTAQFDLQEFFTNRTELAGLLRKTDQRPIISPDTGLRRLARRRARRTGSIDWGSVFDRSG